MMDKSMNTFIRVKFLITHLLIPNLNLGLNTSIDFNVFHL